MAAIPPRNGDTVQAIYRLYEKREAAQEPRGYLGWSQIGEECDRALWYSFRFAGGGEFDGRMLRLFQTGHLEETRVLQELRDIGCEVWDRDPTTGGQFAVSSLGGHLRGHADAVVLGLPEAPKTPHLTDVKSIKAKKFDELMKVGFRKLYPKYHAQGTGYMGHMDLDRAAFVFSCKDDDRMHVERFEFDKAEFDRLMARALKIIKAVEPPLRLSDDPAWFGCKFCNHRDVCHGEQTPTVTCRSCVHATPELDGDARWSCAKNRQDIGIERQRKGCNDHRYIPILLEKFAKPVDAHGDDVVYEMEGGQFVNGKFPGYSSKEIHAAKDKVMLVDEAVIEVRGVVKTARIVEPVKVGIEFFDETPNDI